MSLLLSTNARRATVLLVVLSFGLTGCASQYGQQVTQVNYYPQCYQPMADLRADEHTAAKSTAGGAALGALVGGLIGGLSTGKVEGAVAGAAAGGIAGGAAGYAYGSSQQKKSDQQHLQAYLGQLQGETVTMDRAAAAAKVASNCYNGQFEQAVNAVRAGKMTKPEFSTRYAEIKSGLQETAQILTNASNAMAQKETEYQRVLAEETGQTVAASPAPQTPQKASTKPAKKPTPQKPAKATTPQGRAVADGTAQWQKSRDNLQTTQNDIQEQMSAYERTVAALDA